eukprot:1139220-Pelagomonas_calceolata.AAC.6
MPSIRAGGALREPRWPSSAQLPNREVSELPADGLPHLTDTAVLHQLFCLAYMLGFRAGGVLDGPGQPGVNTIGKKAKLGAHAP